MKKLIYGGLFLALVGIVFVACKKDDIKTSNSSQAYSGVSADGKMLRFSSIEAYEAIINDPEVKTRDKFLNYISGLNYKNYFSAISTKLDFPQKDQEDGTDGETEIQEMDEVLGAMLNDEGVLQIENHLYKIDLIKGKVFVIEAANEHSDYSDLISGNTNNPHVSDYSVIDDVIHIVNGNPEGKCAGSSGFSVWNETTDPTLKIRVTVKLFAGGVLHRVTGRAQKTGTYNGNYVLKVEAGLNPIRIKRKPCSNNEVTYHATGIKAQGSNSSEVVFEAYSKSWSVKNMYMYARTKAEFLGDGVVLYRETNYRGVNF